LFGEGLGLDSIDALELALAISKTYGFQLRSDDKENRRVFASLRALSQHIAATANPLGIDRLYSSRALRVARAMGKQNLHRRPCLIGTDEPICVEYRLRMSRVGADPDAWSKPGPGPNCCCGTDRVLHRRLLAVGSMAPSLNFYLHAADAVRPTDPGWH
jgi:hypothetical protein